MILLDVLHNLGYWPPWGLGGLPAAWAGRCNPRGDFLAPRRYRDQICDDWADVIQGILRVIKRVWVHETATPARAPHPAPKHMILNAEPIPYDNVAAGLIRSPIGEVLPAIIPAKG